MTAYADLSTREAYGRVLVELGAQYKDIVVLDADLSRSTPSLFSLPAAVSTRSEYASPSRSLT
jgi:transketolase C-terminal domain/subunit